MENVLYRYDSEPRYDGGVTIYLTKYPIIRETEKGAWVNGKRGEPTFCLEGAGKRFAHTSKNLAFDSFKARKRRQNIILSAQLAGVQKVQEAIEKLGGAVPDVPTTRWSEYELMEFQGLETCTT